MSEEYLNPATYIVIDRITGEEVNIDLFVKKVESSYWEKAYASTLAEYIGVTGSAQNKVLAYILKNKESNNMLYGTVRGIAEESKTTQGTVSTIFRLLIQEKLLKKIRNGCYLLSPQVLRHGSKNRGAMLLRLWDDS